VVGMRMRYEAAPLPPADVDAELGRGQEYAGVVMKHAEEDRETRRRGDTETVGFVGFLLFGGGLNLYYHGPTSFVIAKTDVALAYGRPLSLLSRIGLAMISAD
jgi:hypothetical protein